MKKNIMMRLASFLLVAVLISTSAISGTYAKYVTTNGGADTARVAKFGVKIEVADDLAMFNTQYDKEDDTYAGTLSVESSTSDQVVAPGTKGSMTFKISGKPEVATRVSIAFDAQSKAIQLAAGEYTLPEGYFAADDTTITTDFVYEPIKFYFGEKAADTLSEADYTMTLEQLKSAMSTEFTKDYVPNFDFSTLANGGTYTLAWIWEFEDTDIANVNFLDTYLGYQAANGDPQWEVLDFDITVTQID